MECEKTAMSTTVRTAPIDIEIGPNVTINDLNNDLYTVMWGHLGSGIISAPSSSPFSEAGEHRGHRAQCLRLQRVGPRAYVSDHYSIDHRVTTVTVDAGPSRGS